MIHRNVYTGRVNWRRTMLEPGPWIAVVAFLWAGIIFAVWRITR
ncbi:MAG: hypothetical protein WC211_03790 [Dehalococcoidia bacterium]